MLEATYEVWIDTPTGIRLQCVDIAKLEYARTVNTVGSFKITISGAYNERIIQPDSMIEIWRGFPASKYRRGLRLEFLGLVDKWSVITDPTDGFTYIEIEGTDMNGLLERRVVYYSGQSIQGFKNGAADICMKQVVRENLGPLCLDGGRDLTGLGFTIDVDYTTAAPLIAQDISGKTVLEALKQIVDAATQQNVAVFYDIIPYSATQFKFYTFVGQRGVDHSLSSAQPVFLTRDNVDTATFVRDFSAAVSHAYVGGPGQKGQRNVVDQVAPIIANLSPWARREKFVSGTQQTSIAALETLGQATLWDGRPIITFTGDIVSTEGATYGLDWGFGDLVTIKDRQQLFNAYVLGIGIQIDNQQTSQREKLTTSLEVQS